MDIQYHVRLSMCGSTCVWVSMTLSGYTGDRLSDTHITYFHNIHYSYSYSASTCLLKSCILMKFQFPCTWVHCADDESEMYYAWKIQNVDIDEGVNIFQGRSKDFSPFLKY